MPSVEVMTLWTPGDVEFVAAAAASADATTRRGISITARAEAEAEFSAAIGGNAGKLIGEVSADVNAAFRGAFPVDFWQACGLVVEASLGARAKASIAASGQLSLEALRKSMAADLPPVFRGPALEAFLAETRIEAGGFAEVEFAVEVHAHCIFCGTLLPQYSTDSWFSRDPGFVFTCGAGFGIAFGAGYNAAVAIRIGDPAALVRGVLTPLSDAVALQLSQAKADGAADAARIVLPAAIDAALRIPTLRVGGGDEFIAEFVGDVQERLRPIVVQQAVLFALRHLSTLIPALGGVSADAARVEQARLLVEEARSAVTQLSAADGVLQELRVVVRVLDAVREVVFVTGGDETAMRALEAAASVIALADRVVTRDSYHSVLSTALAALVPYSQWVPGAGEADPLLDLVVERVGPLLPKELDWLARLAGTDRDGLLHAALSVTAAAQSGVIDHDSVLNAVVGVVESSIRPALVGVVDDELRVSVVDPLCGIVTSVLHGLSAPDVEGVTLARERVSALLLASIGRFAITAADTCSAQALKAARAEIDKLVAILEDLGADPADQRSILSDIELAAGWLADLVVTEANVALLLKFAKHHINVVEKLQPICVEAARVAIASAPATVPQLDQPGSHHPEILPLSARAAKEVGLSALGLLPELTKLWLAATKNAVVEVPKRWSEASGIVVGAAIDGFDAAIEAIVGHEVELDRIVHDGAVAAARASDAIAQWAAAAQIEIAKVGDDIREWIKDRIPGTWFDFLGDVAGFVWDLLALPIQTGLVIVEGVAASVSAFFMGIAEGSYPAANGFGHARGYLASSGFNDAGATIDGDHFVVPAATQYDIAVARLATNSTRADDDPRLPAYVRLMRSAQRAAEARRTLRAKERAIRAALEEERSDVETLKARKAGLKAQPNVAIALKIDGRVPGEEEIVTSTDGTPLEITVTGANAGFDGSQVGIGSKPMSIYGWEETAKYSWRWRGVLVTASPPEGRSDGEWDDVNINELLEWKMRPLPEDLPLPGLPGLPRVPVPPLPGPRPPRTPVPRPLLLAPSTADAVLGRMAALRRGTFVEIIDVTRSSRVGERPLMGGTSPRRLRVRAEREVPAARRSRGVSPLREVVRSIRAEDVGGPLGGHLEGHLSPAIEVRPGLQRLIATFADGLTQHASADAIVRHRTADPPVEGPYTARTQPPPRGVR